MSARGDGVTRNHDPDAGDPVPRYRWWSPPELLNQLRLRRTLRALQKLSGSPRSPGPRVLAERRGLGRVRSGNAASVTRDEASLRG